MPISEGTLSLSENYNWMARAFSFLGMFGVPVFIFLSGYLFKKGKLYKRITSLIIPLLIWGTITYLVHCLPADTPFNLQDYFLWIIGSNCYLYFVSILVALILCFNLYDNPLVWLLLGLISIYATQLEWIRYTSILTPYMNPLNFVPYFSLGYLVRKYDYWSFASKWITPMIAAFVIVVSYFIPQYYDTVWYFNMLSLIVNFSFIIVLMGCVCHLKQDSNWIVKVGSYSFVIYFSHMQVASTLNKMLPRYFCRAFEPIKIIFAFALVLGLVFIVDTVLSKLSLIKLKSYLGYRA